MLLNKTTARQTAGYLLDIEAVKLSPDKPFTWASGMLSPIYCDNRLALSFPKIRKFIASSLVKEIKKRELNPYIIAGVATGAIAIGVLAAEELGLPFVYVRPEPKKHGRQNRIEGVVSDGDRVVVMEDLISTGGSSLQAASALREAGADVLSMYAIMTYGFEKAEVNFRNARLQLYTLCNYDVLICEAAKRNYIDAAQTESLKNWRLDPEKWKKI